MCSPRWGRRLDRDDRIRDSRLDLRSKRCTVIWQEVWLTKKEREILRSAAQPGRHLLAHGHPATGLSDEVIVLTAPSM
ncbi:MAG: hypothetical protein ACLS37_12630 [Alistipes sp.]